MSPLYHAKEPGTRIMQDVPWPPGALDSGEAQMLSPFSCEKQKLKAQLFVFSLLNPADKLEMLPDPGGQLVGP